MLWCNRAALDVNDSGAVVDFLSSLYNFCVMVPHPFGCNFPSMPFFAGVFNKTYTFIYYKVEQVGCHFFLPFFKREIQLLCFKSMAMMVYVGKLV